MLQIRVSDAIGRWSPAVSAALLWCLAALLAVLWWLHLPRGQGQAAAPAEVAATSGTQADRQGVARALGHASPAAARPDEAQRFAVLGVVAAGSGRGSALLAVDGQPPQVFLLGQTVAPGWRLQAVAAGEVRLSPESGGQALALQLPLRP